MNLINLVEGEESTIEQRIKDKNSVPNFHIYPPYGGYLNDVNAFFKYKNKYHLFFQYGYYANDTGVKCWMHFSSFDLVNWKFLGAPLLPDSPFDNKGVWSGNVFFDKDGNPMIIYYAYSYGLCLAYPEDLDDEDLTKWKKHEANPVLPQKESQDYTVYDVSNVFTYNEKYCVLTGNKNVQTGRPANYLFTSTNLLNWEFVGEFFTCEELEDKEDVACPNLVQIDNERYLYTFSSHLSGVRWHVGKIEDFKFVSLKSGKINHYGANEMGQSVFKDDSDIVYKSWLTMRLKDEILLDRGWSGVLTLPKVLKVDSDNNLTIYPHPKVDEQFSLKLDQTKSLDASEYELPFKSNSCKIDLKLKHVGIAGVCVGVGEEEKTLVYVDKEKGELVVDFEKSSKDNPMFNKYMFEFRDYQYLSKTTVSLDNLSDEINLTVYFDKCVLEVFCCGQSVGKTFLPNELSNGIKIFANKQAKVDIKIFEKGC